MHNKYIITYECHDNAPRMWKVVQLIREIFWLLPVLSLLLPVVSHFSFVSTWKRSHFSLSFQNSGSPATCQWSLLCSVFWDERCLLNKQLLYSSPWHCVTTTLNTVRHIFFLKKCIWISCSAGKWYWNFMKWCYIYVPTP